MVEYWTEYTNARIYGLHDENEQVWHFVEIFAADTYTEFTIKFEGWSTYGVTSDYLFYPLQWTRVCLSMDSNSSEVQFVVEGELLVHKPIWVKKRPDNLNLTLGKGSKKNRLFLGNSPKQRTPPTHRSGLGLT